MKAIRTLWRTEEVEVERQITVTELEEQDRKFIVVELDEDDVDMLTRIINFSDHDYEGKKMSYIYISPNSNSAINRSKLNSWPKFVKKIRKAWDK